MERLDLEDNSPAIEVLEGQMSVEELLAELGFEWQLEPGSGNRADEAEADAGFSQPVLF